MGGVAAGRADVLEKGVSLLVEDVVCNRDVGGRSFPKLRGRRRSGAARLSFCGEFRVFLWRISADWDGADWGNEGERG